MAQSKKDFTADAAGVFVDKMLTPSVAPKPTTKATRQVPEKRHYAKVTGAEIKTCFMLSADIERKLRYISFAERRPQKAILADALLAYIADYEKAHGGIK